MPATLRTKAYYRLASSLAIAVASLAALNGCVGYNAYPPEPGNYGFKNPNDDPFPPVMTEAVRWCITRYPAVEHAEWSPPLGVPPEGSRFAVNLPVGVNRMVYQRVVDRIGFGAVPMEPGNENLPTYHVSRVIVSGDDARVDVVRPVPGMPSTASGQRPTQGITVRLRGGLQPWHVTSHRVWELNTLEVPALNYVPEPGAPTPRPGVPEPLPDGPADDEGATPTNAP